MFFGSGRDSIVYNCKKNQLIYILTYSAILINNIVLSLQAHTLTQYALLLCLCIYLPNDDDLVQVEMYRRNISDKLLFVTDCAFVGLIL